jgi:hypothetical protein
METSAKKTPWLVWQKTSWLPGYVLCAAGLLLCVVGFYPGYMSPDSIRQLTEGRAWSFTDWHPPLMAAVWGMSDRVIPGPFGMLLLQNAAFWGALGLFWRMTYRRSVRLGLCLVAFGFLPTTLALLSTIWKDVGLGVALLLASALLYTARQSDSIGALLGSIPLLFYGFGVRQNAAPAILPLALWSGFIACRVFSSLRVMAGRFRVLPFALGLAYFLFLMAAVLTTTRILTGGRSSYILQTVLLHDLSAISKERGEALFPDYVLRDEGFSLEKVSTQYQPYIATPIVPGRGSGLRLTENPEEIAALRAKWLEVVPENKGVYLRHRWEAFKWAVGFNKEHVCFPYLATSRSFDGYDVNDWRIHQYLRALFWKLRDTFLFRGFFWLLVCLVLLCVALGGRLRGDLELVFVLSLSGFLYGVAYFFFAPACDFRFFWWTALAALVSMCFSISFAAHLRPRRRAATMKS